MQMTPSRSIRALLAGSAALFLAAACSSGSSSSTWTFVPPQPTATAGASGSPGASSGASTAPSTAPSSAPSAAPSEAPSSAPSAVPSAAPSEAPSGAPSGSPAASEAPSGQTIELELTGSLSITQGGQQVTTLDVKQGETITFKVTNTAGFGHDFFIGPADALSNNQTTGLPGIPEFSDGTQELTYTVTADTASLEFACTVPGHYPLMHGTFTVEP